MYITLLAYKNPEDHNTLGNEPAMKLVTYDDFEIAAAHLLDNDPPRGERSHPGLRAQHRSAAGAAA